MTTIIDIINHAGLDNVKSQFLAQSFVSGSRKKHDTEVTFATSHEMGSCAMKAPFGVDGSHVGIVLWIPTATIKAMISDAKPAAQNGGEQS